MQARLEVQNSGTAPNLPGDLAARYEIVRVLGRGGQGTTFLARDRDTGADVAIKLLELPDVATWKDVELFRREVAVLKQLRHPAIPRYLESVLDDASGSLALVREYVAGESLHEVLERDETLGLDEARELLAQILDVLEHLHGLLPPVVHRDIKPQNIIRREDDGRYALIDFGAVSAATVLTGGSTFVGTNGYMPAEQLMGRADARSDLYALGATVVQILSGHHPQNLVGDGMRMRLDVLPQDCDSLRPVLERMVEPVPERRYQSAKRVLAALSTGSALVLAEEQPGLLRVMQTQEALEIRLPPMLRVWSYLPPFGLAMGYLLFVAVTFGIAEILVATLAAAITGFATRHFFQRVITLTEHEMRYSRGLSFLPSVARRLPRADVLDVERMGLGGPKHDSLSVQPKSGRRLRLGLGVPPGDLDWVAQRIRRWAEEESQ